MSTVPHHQEHSQKEGHNYTKYYIIFIVFVYDFHEYFPYDFFVNDFLSLKDNRNWTKCP